MTQSVCARTSAPHEAAVQASNRAKELTITDTITPDQVVQAARELDQDEFTRAEVADKLNVERPEIRDAFKAARKAGHLRKVSTNEKGKPRFQISE